MLKKSPPKTITAGGDTITTKEKVWKGNLQKVYYYVNYALT